MTAPRMDGDAYEDSHGFVWGLGASVVEWLDPRPGEAILDLGCGGGQLTATIAAAGATVTGIDLLPDLVHRAKERYPTIDWRVADMEALDLGRAFDAVFSNAALHWARDPEAVVAAVARHVRPGGRFVAEFGGAGNCSALIAAILDAHPDPRRAHPWWFPAEGELTGLLEDEGFAVREVIRFPRPTPLPDGPAAWVRAFGGWALADVDDEAAFLASVEERARAELWTGGGWVGDYVRIRVRAERVPA